MSGIDRSAVEQSIRQYQEQQKQLEQQLQQIEQNYQQQRALAAQTIQQLVGAIAALETLLEASPSERDDPQPEQ